MYILSSSGNEDFSTALSNVLGCSVVSQEKRRFPDGEQYIRVTGDLEEEDVIVVVNGRNEISFFESLLSLEAVRGLKPRSIIAFMPYFSYARQHMRYMDGEAVSAKVVLDSLSLYADCIVSVDVHDSSVSKLSRLPFRNILVYDSISRYYSALGIDIVISPDDGGVERAAEIGKSLGVKSANFEKVRIDSRRVEMKIPDDLSLEKKNILILDDIISTGGTIMKSVDIARDHEPGKIFVCGIHGIFVNGVDEKISSRVDDLAVTNTVKGRYSKIDVTREVASSLKGVLNGIRA